MSTNDLISIADLEKEDQVLPIGRDYIPNLEKKLRNTIYSIFQEPGGEQTEEIGDFELLAEAVFWSLGELINNANKANNRWAILRNALYQRASKQNPDIGEKQLYKDIDYAIQHNQGDFLKKYQLESVDLSSSILKLIEMHKTNSFALSEKFSKKIDLTMRVRKKGDQSLLTVNVINNSPITEVDRDRVEYNLEKIKEDLINSEKNPFEATAELYEKPEDHAGGGFGAGLRSIVLFIKEGYRPFRADITYSKLIQYRSAGYSTIFSIELVIPMEKRGG